MTDNIWKRTAWAQPCCKEAKKKFCVCRAYYTCPIHGSKHWGTHD